jgi:DNA-binding MarR family transcriptional regulator
MTNSVANDSQANKRSKGWEWLSQSRVWAANAPWPLMFRVSRANRLIASQLEEKLNLSIPQMRILFEALDPGGVSQATLYKRYNVDPASITRTVQVMERDGLITRSPDPDDNRFMRVFITEKGRQLAEEMPRRLAEFEQRLVKGLTESEILQLHNLLERLELGLAEEN